MPRPTPAEDLLAALAGLRASERKAKPCHLGITPCLGSVRSRINLFWKKLQRATRRFMYLTCPGERESDAGFASVPDWNRYSKNKHLYSLDHTL